MMKVSRVGIFAFISIAVLLGSNCGTFNRIMARKNLVDGSKAYKDRKFKDAEQLFRAAVARDPKGETKEGQTAQLFLARTLHSEFIGNRVEKQYAEDAITQYQKALQMNPNDQSSYKAIASLYENLQRPDDWLKWVTARANNASIPPEQRAEALTSLAAKKNTCANDISDTDQTKKKVTKEGKEVYQYTKPQNAQDFETLKACVDDGMKLIDQAIALETPDVKNAASIVPKSLTDQQLDAKEELLKVFESARSYKASLLVQAMRVAEMEGNTAEHDRLKQESDTAKQNFLSLTDIVKRLQAEKDEREAAKEAAKTGGEKVNTNVPANKK
jgi:tetratricopeptide (TPR) repeat protein